LLFTAPQERHADVQRLIHQQGLEGACIGCVSEPVQGQGDCVRVLDAQSRVMDIKISGWDHFA